jgi:Cu(I)/Ag(I) efflux system periplasmic protein CusF
MKHIASPISIVFFAAFGVFAFAQTQSAPSKDSATLGTTAAANAQMAEGEVRRVDKDNGKITLKHGEIKNLDMPAMTMVFNVKDKALLEKIQPGDKVKFVAISEDGKYVVTDLQPAK